ncbi:MAG TPA: DsbA family protein, partial [Methylophilaceae bacterium]|nr:DsbA family protein [Methylophilaceae bacterium]
MASANKIRIDVWSDYVCPFCYLELPEIRKLQASLGEALKVTWRAFELRPEPAPTLDPGGEYLRTTWQRSVYPLARERGMTLKLPPVQPRSRKAMEAAMFAQAQDRFDAMHEAIFSAFFAQGRDIGDVEVLVDIGESAGLLKDDLRRALYDQRYTAEVE